ncbi:YceI family protein [Mucilaginibacter gotjawali]|uniref:Polyisoprenoid-binding protein YceI n=1 Tax=Mucilaginibacter gotjawali TaxID=1550579 RepID=A0A839SR90_9SPHI|nr:YceI family protein [Mucilaginibacter gotjawali]MBB3058979.1 polyisoprenoid-binding protein YceI [Mucilaginibacter gotjawali]
MKRFLFPLFAIIVFSTFFADAQNTVTRSAITFKIKNLGIYTDGTLGGLQADIHFNPADLSSSTIKATVDVNTLNSDNESRDEHVKSADFFDAAHYPTITLKSVAIKHKSGNNYSGQFNLTIKDKTKLIDIPFTCVDKGSTLAFNGAFKLNRQDYGIGGSSMILSDEVIIAIDAEVTKQRAEASR